MIGKILLAYDGSNNARRALDLAAELSCKLEADLSIVHVLMHGRPSKELVRMAEAEHIVDQAQNTFSPSVAYAPGQMYSLLKDSGTTDQGARIIPAIGDQLAAFAKSRSEELGAQNVTTSVRSGDYADEILKTAKKQKADMIVIGSRGLGKIREAVLGSVSQKVLHHAAQTVVTVK
ncbi:MAG: universal stress protein [Yoonia sp.]|nr:universal stress protein [Yoonia sp.]